MSNKIISPGMRKKFRFEAKFWSEDLIDGLIKDYGFPKGYLPDIEDKDSVQQAICYRYGRYVIIAFFDCYELDDMVIHGFCGNLNGKIRSALNYLNQLEG